jgi:hypothetical protein
MSGHINIVPRYLPGYGMAPEWGRAVRLVVVVYTAVSIVITLVFRADVNAQAGAYATGILAMLVSGAVAVTFSAIRRRSRRSALGFGVLTLVLLYSLIANVIEKPDGITHLGLLHPRDRGDLPGVPGHPRSYARTTSSSTTPPAGSSLTPSHTTDNSIWSPTGARPGTRPSTTRRRARSAG